jgi:hypothetical protein
VKLTTLLIPPVDAENGTVRYIVCDTAEPYAYAAPRGALAVDSAVALMRQVCEASADARDASS